MYAGTKTLMLQRILHARLLIGRSILIRIRVNINFLVVSLRKLQFLSSQVTIVCYFYSDLHYCAIEI